MALDYAGSTADYGVITTLPITALPFTVACWANSDSIPDYACILQIGQSAASDSTHRLITNNGAPWTLKVQSANGTAGTSTTANTSANGSWAHCAGVWASTTSRTAYLNGTAATADTTSVAAFTPGRMSVGAYRNLSALYAFNGKIAEIGMWDVALTAAEITMLALGVSPLMVRPGNLVGYWPSVRSAQDVVGGVGLTLNGSVVASPHPRVLLPRGRNTYRGSSPAGVSGALASTTAAATLAASGKRTHRGSLAQTTAAATLSSAGKRTHRGTLAKTTDAATLSALGKHTHRGSLARSTDAATGSATGKVTHRGTLTVTTAAATLAASGSVTGGNLTGNLAVTLASATLAATGKLTHRGSLAVTLADATLAAYQASERFGLLVDSVSIIPALQVSALDLVPALAASAEVTPALRGSIVIH